jgi:hypothetical protein
MVWTGAGNLSPIRIRSVDHPAHSNCAIPAPLPFSDYEICLHLKYMRTVVYIIPIGTGLTVALVNRLLAGRSGVQILPVARDFSFLQSNTDQLWGPSSLIFGGYQVSFLCIKQLGA